MKVFVVTTIVLVILHSQSASAATWYVDGEASVSGDGSSWGSAFQTIQEGIDAASDGDTVIVAESTYFENIRFEGKSIVLQSKDPQDAAVVETTIIDGNDSGSVVTFSGEETENCVLEGFTLQNGKAEDGGGIDGTGTLACIRNNHILNNWANEDGGGLHQCNGIVSNNTISDNESDEEGGGVAECNGTIRDNIIIGNSARDSGGGVSECDATIEGNRISQNTSREGGGLSQCTGAIRDNVITGNEAEPGMGGGLWRCDGTISNNTIASNCAGMEGGGLDRCGGTVKNNIIVGNTAFNGGGLSGCDGIVQNNLIAENFTQQEGRGGGLTWCLATIRNNTIVANRASSGGGVDSCQGTILNCIIWGNTATMGAQVNESSAPTYSCIQDWTGGGLGNISDDPEFENATEDDYHLSANSPCINRGWTEAWMWDAVDLDGTARVLEETVDMGAYERGFSGPWCVDGSVPVSGDGHSWPTAFQTIQEGVDAAAEGQEVIVAEGTYAENVVFQGKNIVLHSTDPSDPKVVASTIIVDGGQKASVITFTGNETAGCLFLGFTVRNGRAEYGGGICGGTEERHTLATIRNNTIAGNSALYGGGGIAFCDGLLDNNVISDNQAEDSGGGLYQCHGPVRNSVISENHAEGNGGGVCDCQGTIRNNTITGNEAAYSGGGFYLCNNTISDNTIHGNLAARGGGLDSCGGTIENNTISGNWTSYGGGGLAWCEGLVRNNIVRTNSAFYGGGIAWGEGTIRSNLIAGNWGSNRGGGLEGCNGEIQNNTIVANAAADRGGGLADCGATIKNCIIWGNEAANLPQLSASSVPDFSCIQNWSEGGEQNTASDPRFLDGDGPDDDPDTHEDNDYRLLASSPCIDAGRNEMWMWNALDMDGNLRIHNGGFSLTVDMGAYEYGSFAFRIVGVVQMDEGEVKLTWKSAPEQNYTVWSCSDLRGGEWNVEDMVASEGETTSWIDPDTSFSHKFYRIGRD